MTASMHVVFLQGMPSPFFSRIGQELSRLGCRVTGINLCAGDEWLWKGNKVNYRGTLADWPKFIGDFFTHEAVTDLVLLGEQREYHKQAVSVAKEKGIRVTVTDFGYLRPDWITLEQDGMSANSKFPRSMEEISKIAAKVPPAETGIKYHDKFFNMAIGDIIYSFTNVFLFWRYPHYRQTVKREHPLIYFPAIGLRLLLAKHRHKKACAFLVPLLVNKTRYYLFPLQLQHDFQIIAYSPFNGIEEALEITIKSFAEKAPTDIHLIFKVHPWDPGFINWRRKINKIAAKYNVTARIDYVEGGSLIDMIKGSLGMVTINSTAAIQALQLGSPVITLGEAIYNIPGLTYQNSIDQYWIDLKSPEPAAVNDFINAIAALVQIRGVFFSENGLTNAVNEATDRIFNQKVGMAGQL